MVNILGADVDLNPFDDVGEAVGEGIGQAIVYAVEAIIPIIEEIIPAITQSFITVFEVLKEQLIEGKETYIISLFTIILIGLSMFWTLKGVLTRGTLSVAGKVAA